MYIEVVYRSAENYKLDSVPLEGLSLIIKLYFHVFTGLSYS